MRNKRSLTACVQKHSGATLLAVAHVHSFANRRLHEHLVEGQQRGCWHEDRGISVQCADLCISLGQPKLGRTETSVVTLFAVSAGSGLSTFRHRMTQF